MTDLSSNARSAWPDTLPSDHIGTMRLPRLPNLFGVFALLFACSVVHAATVADLLEGERAFAFSARMLDTRTLEAQFTVAPGYYLYRDKIQLSVEPGVLAKAPDLPPSTAKHDEFFGDVQTYRGKIKVRLPLAQPVSSEGVAIIAESQGCADLGVCYPPLRQRIILPRTNVEPGAMVYAVPPKRTWFK